MRILFGGRHSRRVWRYLNVASGGIRAHGSRIANSSSGVSIGDGGGGGGGGMLVSPLKGEEEQKRAEEEGEADTSGETAETSERERSWTTGW